MPTPESALRLPAGFAAEAEIEVKRSRFLAHVARVDDEQAARAVVAAARRDHPDARHHCSAFIVEIPGAQPVERSSDDGEPAGTAGTPILETLRGAGLTQVVAVVTRWFGGTLLGTGGLARAYADAVAATLADTPRVRPVRRELVSFDVRPDEAGRLQGALLAQGLDVVDAHWGASVRLTLAVPDVADAAAAVAAIAQRPVPPILLGPTVTEVVAPNNIR